MATYSFDPIFAADPSNAQNVAANAAIIIFDPADTGKTPIALTDVTGSPLPNPITVNKNGFGPAFTSTLDRVCWFGGGFTGFFTSYEGIKAAAVAAQDAAVNAAANAGAAAVADVAARVATGEFTGPKGADGSNVLPTDVAIKDAINDSASATRGALKSSFVPKWAPNTAYVANDKVLSPNGELLSSKINFTSGATYNPANWDKPLDATYGPDAQAASGKVPPRIAALEMVKHWGFGTSYIKGGAGADEGTRFADRVAKRQNALSYTNWGNAGWRAEMILGTVRANWVLNSRALVTVCCAYNDVNQFGNSGAVVTTREGFRGILAYLSAQVNLPVTDPAFSWGPNWTAGATSVAGSYVDVAWTGDTAHLIVDYVSGTAPTLTATSPGAGATVKTVGVGGYSFPVSYGVMTLSGFGAGAHTLRITATGTGTATIRGLLIQSPTPPTVAWFKEGPAVSWTGGAAATYNGYLKDVYLPAMAAVAATFPNVVPVDVDTNWNAAAMLGPDGIHPNDVGNAYIATLIEKALTPSLPFRQGLNQITGSGGSATAYVPATPAYFVTGTPVAPMQVTGLAATSSVGTDAILTWTAPSNGGAAITDYAILYRQTGGGAWTPFAHTASAATAQTITGLTSGTSYDFQVAAINSAGTGGYSNTFVFSPYATIASDSFTRADSSTIGSTPTGAFAWTPSAVSSYVQPTWSIFSNALKAAYTSGTTEGLMYVDTALANGRVKAKMATAGDFGLAFRIASGTSFWMLWAGGPGVGSYKLMKYTGSYATIVSTAVNCAAGDTLEVTLNGSVITAYVNGVQVATTTDAYNSTATKHGFRAAPSSGASFTIDDFVMLSS